MSQEVIGNEGVVTAKVGDPQVVAEGVSDGKKYSKENAILADLAQERKRRQELEARLSDIEKQKLEAEGNKDKLIQSYKDELTKFKAQTGKWIKSKVEDQIAMKAKDLGCLDTDLLMKAINLDAVEVDTETFKIINNDSVLSMLEETRKSKPYLFKQTGPGFRDGTPAAKPNVKSEKVDLKSLKKEEIFEMARKQAGLSKK